jgi:hypothetical protein
MPAAIVRNPLPRRPSSILDGMAVMLNWTAAASALASTSLLRPLRSTANR